MAINKTDLIVKKLPAVIFVLIQQGAWQDCNGPLGRSVWCYFYGGK